MNQQSKLLWPRGALVLYSVALPQKPLNPPHCSTKSSREGKVTECCQGRVPRAYQLSHSSLRHLPPGPLSTSLC